MSYMNELHERLRKLGFREDQIDSLLAPPIYVGQTLDESREDFVSHDTLVYMGFIPVASGTLDV